MALATKSTPPEARQSKIVHIALYERVAKRLRARIYNSEILPGQLIDEKALCEELGISRTPLREALKVLHAEGLVELVPRRGCFVKQIDLDELRELFPVVASLEGLSARLAAQNMSDTRLSHIEALHAQLETYAADDNVDEYYETNIQIHEALIECAHNRWLKRVLLDLRKILRLARHHQLTLSGRLQDSLSEHRQIMDALRSRDPDAAERGMNQHIMAQLDAVFDMDDTSFPGHTIGST